MGKDKKKGGGLFDFNRDGRTDIGEEWVAFKILKEIDREEREREREKEDYYTLVDPWDEWRFYCRDGSEYGLDPYAFSSEALYEEALNEAERKAAEEAERQRYAWRETCDFNDYDIDPEDFETEEEYNDAVEERKRSWAEYLSEDVRERAEKLGVVPEVYIDEQEFLLELELAEARIRCAALAPNPGPKFNSSLAKSLTTGRKTAVLNALRKGFPDAKLSLGVRVSMDPRDGAGEKCAYVLEHIKNEDGKWVLAYTSQDAAEKDGRDSVLTVPQEMGLRSIVRIKGIAGVLFRSRSRSFCVEKQEIEALLTELPVRDSPWDAICTRRTAAARDRRK